MTAKSLTAPAGTSGSRATEPPGQETRERPEAFLSCGGGERDLVPMGATCTGADFDCGRGEEDLDRAARDEVEEAVEIATNIRQSALIGEGPT